LIEAAERQIHTLAFYDPLTGLPNRRLLYDRIGQIITASRRSMCFGAILILDLDNFKVLNDTRGHDTGDALLLEVAGRIKGNMRESDTVARLGGDEFVVVLRDLGPNAHAAAVHAGALANRFRAALAEEYVIGGERYLFPASIGAKLFDGKEDSIESVLKHADVAMYQAKEAGRNTVRFYDPVMQSALEERSSLASDLRYAVERGQLRLYYQPQFNAKGRLIGVEALLRWLHPARGLVPPADFVPIAEETGLIVQIGDWVLDAACETVEWPYQPLGFDSLTLCWSLDISKLCLTSQAAELS
jgi:diguanylate cyclase (GGDEF)-like protein